MEQAAARWDNWYEEMKFDDWKAPRDPILHMLDTGTIGQELFWDFVNRAQPCTCWSCNGECGGSAHTGWCGLVERNELGNLICAACRERTDVLDIDRTGIKASIYQDLVRINPDVWGNPLKTVFMHPATVRVLAARLVTLANILDARVLAEKS